MLFENRSGRNPKEVPLTPSTENVDNDFWKSEGESRRWGYIINIVSHDKMEKKVYLNEPSRN